MQRIEALQPETAKGKTKELFDGIHTKLGMVPAMMRTMGNSPVVLESYLTMNETLGKSSLGGKLGELIALTVANANKCNYCNAAHSFIGEKLAGIEPRAIEAAREGKSAIPKTQAALTFARALLAKKGKVSDEDVQALRSAGYTDAAITEIIAHTALNIFTNYFNNAVAVAIDFPEAELTESAAI